MASTNLRDNLKIASKRLLKLIMLLHPNRDQHSAYIIFSKKCKRMESPITTPSSVLSSGATNANVQIMWAVYAPCSTYLAGSSYDHAHLLYNYEH